MDRSWYAVQTKSRCEEQVLRWLRQRHQLEVFLPKLAVSRRRRSRRVLAIETLFPCYLFVHMSLDPERWYAVKWTPGVKGFVGTGDLTVPVPEEAIRLLRERCVYDNVIPWSPSFRQGSTVRIIHGPFAGLMGILERPATQAERVRVLLNLLGGSTPVEVDITDLEEVS